MKIFISLKGPGHLCDMNFDLVDIDNINQVKGHIMHSSKHNEFHPKSITDTIESVHKQQKLYVIVISPLERKTVVP